MGFAEAWKRTHALEGGYSNNPKDPGGETNHGITKRVALAYGYSGDMKALSEERAAAIGKAAFWDTLSLDRICVLSEKIAEEVFDTGYNCGQSTAGKFLQRSLNAFNRQQKDFQDITVDGRVGLGTIGALSAYLQKRGVSGEMVLLRALNALQGAYYIEIATKNEELEEFEFGWFQNRL